MVNNFQASDDGAIVQRIRNLSLNSDSQDDSCLPALLAEQDGLQEFRQLQEGQSGQRSAAGSNAAAKTAGHHRLTEQEMRMAGQLRQRIKSQIPANYDTDCNLLRWIKSADRSSKSVGNVELAETMLLHHLRFRKALKLDGEIPNWDDNPMFSKRYLPRGYLHYMPSSNRFLWWVDYSSVDMPGVMNSVTSTDMLIWHFWKYEHMLRVVNDCERRTGALSGVTMIMDLKDYDMNPFSLLFSSNGQMTYYAQLIHYEHYPELTLPVSIINVARWLMLPYRLIKAVMPRDFTERIRVFDGNFRDQLLTEMTEQDLPTCLGGKNPETDSLRTIPAAKLDPANYYQRRVDARPDGQVLSHIQISARKRRLVTVECQAGARLSWWFVTDGDIHFGVFFQPPNDANPLNAKDKQDVVQHLEMVYPLFRLQTKLVPEHGRIQCEKTGTYVFVFCNKHSWVARRNIQTTIEIDGVSIDRTRVLERSFSSS